MNYTILRYFLPVVPFVLYLLTIGLPVIAQTSTSIQEDTPGTVATSSGETATSTELSVAVSIVFPSGTASKAALKPGDSFAIQIAAPNMGISDVSVNYDELGIGTVPVADSGDGIFVTQMRGLPFLSTGTKHYSVMFKDSLGNAHTITKTLPVDATKPTGSITATFTKTSNLFSVHLSGNIDGTGSGIQITRASVYGIDSNGAKHIGTQLDTIPTVPGTLSRIDTDAQVPAPDTAWTKIGYSLTVEDTAGNIAIIFSDPTLIADIVGKPLIDHAMGGSVVTPVSYGKVPSGIGIPHTLINSLPEGDYYAVVFFEGLQGCPNDNFMFNSFIDDNVWGVDRTGNGYVKAQSTSAGGCMQLYHVDPTKGEQWLWGALSATGSATAIADSDGVPAFALCHDAATCDAIAPRDASTASSGDGEAPAGISSVMFLPGIKGSRLYENNPLCLVPSEDCNIPLWLPLGDLAAPELFMNESGKSKRRAYVQEGDILSSAYGQHFYDTFFQKMDQAEKSHIYGAAWEWKPIAYDWRMSLHDIVSNGAQYGNRIYYEDATSTPYIEQSLRALASSSPTGKVTIIAHSNGGMIAKELLKRLGDAEASRLVDTLILVGTPQSGAPRALGALLYGDAEGIPAVGRFANLIISSAHAREFALNSPMAYQLLPSANYMSARNEKYPLVRFGSGTLLAHQRALYGGTIDTDAELQEYLLGDSGARSAPDASDLTHASVANANLLADATDAHDSLDMWAPPPGIQIYQIGGYGVDTVSGIDTYEAPSRSGKDTLSYLPLFTQEGDGTVPIISSFMMNAVGNVHDIWVDMSRLSTGIDYSHGTMFEVPDIESAIDTILQAPLENTSTTTLYAAPMNDEPSMKSQKRISFFVHSPSSLTVTDSAGNQTRVRSDGTSIQAIPGSESGTFGEVEFITVPADGSYSVSITDMSPGEVTFDMQDRNGGDVTATSTIAAIPVTASSVVSATIENTIGSTSPLDVDENGDGTVDLSITPVLGTTIISPDVPVQANGTSSTSYVRTIVVEHVKKALSAVRELAKPLGFSAVSPVVSDHASTSRLATTSTRTPSRDFERSDIHAQGTTTESATMTPAMREEQDVPADQRRSSWWRRLLYLLKHLWHDILAFLGVTSR